MKDWAEFLTAEISATATLAGLLFVALSLNISKIITSPRLVELGVQSLVVLIGSLLELSVSLVPQPRQAIGREILAVAVFVWFIMNRSLARRFKAVPEQYRHTAFANIFQSQAATIPGVICGAALSSSLGGSFYWLAIGTLISITLAAYNSWVLLVEILR